MAEEIPQAEEQKKDKPPYLFCGCVGLFIFFMFGAYTLFAGDQKLGGDGESLRNTLYGPGEPGSGVGSSVEKTCIKGVHANADKWVNIVNKAAAEYGQDPAFMLAQIEAESGFNPEATSGAGAHGIAQFMPGTFVSTANKYNIDGGGGNAKKWTEGADGKEDYHNPYDQIMAQAAYNSYIQKYLTDHGVEASYDNIIASYNAGEGAVVKYGGVPPFGETKRYIANIRAAYKKYAKCLPQSTVNTNGVSSAIQKLLDAMGSWPGYVRGKYDCFKANIYLINSVYGTGYPVMSPSYYKTLPVDPAANYSIPTVNEMNKMNNLIAKGYIIMWHVEGGGPGHQHWIIPIQFYQKSDGYYVDYIENVGSKKETNKISWQEAKGRNFFANPTVGSMNSVRGMIINLPGAK